MGKFQQNVVDTLFMQRLANGRVDVFMSTAENSGSYRRTESIIIS